MAPAPRVRVRVSNTAGTRKAPRSGDEQVQPLLSPRQERIATLLAEAVVAELRCLDGHSSQRLPLTHSLAVTHDPERVEEDPKASGTDAAPVRRPCRRASSHRQEVGGEHAADTEHHGEAHSTARGKAAAEE